MTKIDPSLIKEVELLSNKKNNVECLIYSNNYHITKRCLAGYDFVEFPFIKAFGLKLDKDNILNFANFRHIDYITGETKVSAQINVAKKIINVQSLYEQKIFGNGITVAVIDTGIFPHVDFLVPKNRIVFFKDFVNGKEHPYDDNGHGTFVAGMVGAGGIVDKKYQGVAPNCDLISLK
ncbi:MAG: S8 family serine peptidase, partial [Christensenellales bacterium]